VYGTKNYKYFGRKSKESEVKIKKFIENFKKSPEMKKLNEEKKF